MRIEFLVCVATTAFTLGICEAMAAPIDPEAQPLALDDVQSADSAEKDEPLDRLDPPSESEDALPRCELDGCEYEHQGCVCSNTGWNGYCGWGYHHPGCLYCHCD
ncbi:hypothetical protein [Nannocystis radixulma]|uniref:Uncharacterized protein n=1 Tax=Nannocystis radixulma TaxID=2995305 RepID=A0ABT5BGY0_9BACT|nr:hypothetical protein [Nannocystis radixulma]MDC0672794.1 hypothetical protein [Nannocystis radixulma]